MEINGCVNFLLAFFITANTILTIMSSYDFFEYKKEFIKKLEMSWEQYPIQNISLTKKEGYEELVFLKWKGIKKGCECSHVINYSKLFEGKECNEYHKKAGCYDVEEKEGIGSKIYNTTFYVSYYKEKYLSLFSRIDKNGLCKEGFKRCGYLDYMKNVFCVKENEICPINYLYINNSTNNTSVITDNSKIDSTIINNLYVSEYYYFSILNLEDAVINDYCTYLNNQLPYYPFNYNRSFLNHFQNRILKKNEFFIQNDLYKGQMPKWYNYSNLYLFYLVYPGNYLYNPINFFYTGLVKCQLFFKILFLILRILSVFLILYLIDDEKYKSKSQYKRFVIILIIFYVLLFLINILLLIGNRKVEICIDLNREHGYIYGLTFYDHLNIIIMIIDFLIGLIYFFTLYKSIKQLKQDDITESFQVSTTINTVTRENNDDEMETPTFK
jgi:hypothetical protein